VNTAGGRPPRRFFALWPDQATRHHLEQVARDCLGVVSGQTVAAADFHLTLVFLGRPDEAQQAGLVAAARGLTVPAFDLRLDRCGWFEGPRVFWLGCSEVPVALATLAGALAARAAALGIGPDPRPFLPHVTIARKVAAPPPRVVPAPVRWRVRGFALVAGRDGEQGGARYRPSHLFPQSG